MAKTGHSEKDNDCSDTKCEAEQTQKHTKQPNKDRANKDPRLIYAASKPEKYAHKGMGYGLKRIQNQTVSQTGYHVMQKTGKAHKATKLTKRQAD